MDKKNNRNKLSSGYDDDMDWLDDDDDYLEDGGLLGSLLFGNNKKKKKVKTEKTTDNKKPVERKKMAAEDNREDRPPVPKADDKPARRRKPSQDRTPVKLDPDGESAVSRKAASTKTVRKPVASVGTAGEYDEYYHENTRIRKSNSSRSERGVSDSGNTVAQRRTKPVRSVDSLLKEVNVLEEDSRTRHEELRREAWERTQRNVAKAKAEVERLEIEREQNAREEARKQRVQQEMKRRQEEEEKKRARKAAEEDAGRNELEKVAAVNNEDMEPVAEENVETHIEECKNTNPNNPEKEIAGDVSEKVAENESDKGTDAEVESESDDSISGSDDKLDMDELERIERDIDEDKLNYSESDTADLGLGDIGKALGFDEVELEDDEEEPEDEEESDSEKFFRENLLDEADPKVINPERIRNKISTKVWAIAFFVLLILFILICVIYVKNYARMKYSEMNINTISADQLLTNDGVKDATSGYRTIALYGLDSRDTNLDVGANSDSIIIASINESTKEIKLVSVYRDTLMEIASGSKDTQKVNYAYQLGGAVTAINTLNINLDLNITDYVAVDFNAMADIIDAVGGVDIDVTGEEINNFNKNLAEQISLSGKYSAGITDAGSYTLDGQQAVAYSRIRSTGLGDVTRTERQRIVLMKVISKLLSADTGSLDAFIDVSFKSISTSFDKNDIHDLAKRVASYKLTDTVGFPFAYEAADVADKGNCLVAADMSSNVAALHEYLYGTHDYKVSSTVQQISTSLETQTGIKAQTVKITTEQPGDGISGAEDSDGDLRTIKTPPKGMITEE